MRHRPPRFVGESWERPACVWSRANDERRATRSADWPRGVRTRAAEPRPIAAAAQPSDSKENGWRPRIEGRRTSRGVAKRRSGWSAKPNRWKVDGAEQANRNCSTGHTVVAAGTSPNHPWHRGDMGDGRPVALSDGGVGRCGAEDVRSSIETATDKERPEQGYG
jgi:hypothetical protein